MKLDGSEINLFVAFVGGIVTFFASCLLPLVPTYIAYLSGVSANGEGTKKEIILNSFLFTLGFVSVFTFLGMSASTLGLFIKQNRAILQRIGGAFLIFVGFFMLDLFKFEFLYRERKININYEVIKWKKLKSFVTGLTFGFAWTPCIGPVLGVILFWASQAATIAKGTLLLLVYGVGLGVPFIVVGVLFEKIDKFIPKGKKIGLVLNKVAAGLILLTGVLLLVGKLHLISLALLKVFKIDSIGI